MNVGPLACLRNTRERRPWAYNGSYHFDPFGSGWYSASVLLPWLFLHLFVCCSPNLASAMRHGRCRPTDLQPGQACCAVDGSLARR